MEGTYSKVLSSHRAKVDPLFGPQRMAAGPGPKAKDRCKLSIMTEANCEASLTLPPQLLMPYNSNFYPKGADSSNGKKLRDNQVGNDLVAMKFIPKAEPLITAGDMDDWDYLVRMLFINNTFSLEQSLKYVFETI